MKKLRRKIMRKAARIAFDSLKDSAVKSAAESVTDKKTAQSPEKPSSKTVGSIVIREMRKNDRTEVVEMMREALLAKEALTKDSDAVFKRNISECLSDSTFLDGYVFAYKEAEDSLWGYALVAHGFSTEAGKPCMWTDDLYLREEARGLGLTPAFLSYIGDMYPDEVFRFTEQERSDG